MDFRIESLRENRRDILERLIEIDRAAFGDAGLDEWTFVPFIRHGRIMVLYQRDEVIGDAQFIKDWEDPSKAYLYGVAIAPEHRGKGWGTKLLKACLEELGSQGITRVELTVSADNEGAVKVYKEKLGFEIVGERKDEYGKGEDRLVMELKI